MTALIERSVPGRARVPLQAEAERQRADAECERADAAAARVAALDAELEQLRRRLGDQSAP